MCVCMYVCVRVSYITYLDIRVADVFADLRGLVSLSLRPPFPLPFSVLVPLLPCVPYMDSTSSHRRTLHTSRSIDVNDDAPRVHDSSFFFFPLLLFFFLVARFNGDSMFSITTRT